MYNLPDLVCVNNNAVNRLCKSVKCSKNPFMCKVNRCVCENNHKKCNTVLYNTLREAIQKYGLDVNPTFNQEISKIKKIYEKLQQVINKQKSKFEGWVQDLRRGLKHTQFLELVKSRKLNKINSELIYDTEKEINDFKVKIFDEDECDEFMQKLDKLKQKLAKLQKNIVIRPELGAKLQKPNTKSQVEGDVAVLVQFWDKRQSLQIQLSLEYTIYEVLNYLNSQNIITEDPMVIIVKDGNKNLLSKFSLIRNIVPKDQKLILYLQIGQMDLVIQFSDRREQMELELATEYKIFEVLDYLQQELILKKQPKKVTARDGYRNILSKQFCIGNIPPRNNKYILYLQN